jgi:hypothetical protein
VAVRWVRQSCALIAWLVVSACAKHWEPTEPGPAPDLGDGSQVRVTLEGDSTVVLRNPAVVDDYLSGTVRAERCFPSFADPRRLTCADSDTTMSYPLADITGVETWETDASHTAGLWIGIVGVPLLLAAIVLIKQEDCGPPLCVRQ